MRAIAGRDVRHDHVLIAGHAEVAGVHFGQLAQSAEPATLADVGQTAGLDMQREMPLTIVTLTQP
jgi:hypothetical protein